MTFRSPRYIAQLVALAVIYFITGKLGLMISPVSGFATLAWPPTGISLAALLLLGYSLWPGITLGALVLNFVTGAPFLAAFGIAVGNTSEALFGVYLLRRYFQFRISFDRLRDAFSFLFVTVFLSSPVSATIGSLSLLAGGVISRPKFSATLLAWWVGDAVSHITVAPFLLVWATTPRIGTFSRWKGVGAAALILCLFGICFAIFSGQAGAPFLDSSAYFISPFPIVIWAAIQFGKRGAVTVSLVVSIFAIWGTIQGQGAFFSSASLIAGLYNLQFYQAVTAATALVLATVVEESKRATKALQDNVNLLQTVVEGTTDAVYAKDRQGRYLIINTPGARIWGKAVQDFIGNDDTTIFSPESSRKIMDADRKIMESRESCGFEEEAKVGDKVLVFHTIKAPHFDANGNVLGIVGISRDITERKRWEESLQATAALKTAILESALDSVISMDYRGLISEFNAAAEKMFGYSRAEALGKELASLIIPLRFRDAYRRGLAKYLETGIGPMVGVRMELPAMRANKTEFSAEVSLSRAPLSGPVSFTGFIRDISDRKRAEEKSRFLGSAGKILSESLDYDQILRKISQLAVENLADWCVIDTLSEEGVLRRVAITHKNPSKSLITQQLEQLPPNMKASGGVARAIRSGEDILFPDSSSGQTLSIGIDEVLAIGTSDLKQRKLVAALGVVSYVTSLMRTQRGIVGAITFVSSKPARLYDKDDLDIARELAERAAYAMENARLFSQVATALRTRDEFLSIASHELKTPLTSMKLQTQLTQLLGARDEKSAYAIEKMKKFIEHTDHQINRLNRLVDDMLDVSRVSTGNLPLRPEPFNLSVLICEVVDRLGPLFLSAGCTVTLKVPDEITGTWDRYRLEQVIVNLLTNSAKYGAGKPIEIEAWVRGDNAVMIVRDSGRGIAKEDQERIFQRFERAVKAKDFSGLGLGLYITHQIVKMHQGNISVESELGHGAKFIVTLPLGNVKAVHEGV